MSVTLTVTVTTRNRPDETPERDISLYFATPLAFNATDGGATEGKFCTGGQRMAKVQNGVNNYLLMESSTFTTEMQTIQ